MTVLFFLAQFVSLGAIYIASSLSKWGANVDTEVMAVIVGATLAFLASQLNTIWQSRNQTTSQINQQKIEVYERVAQHLANSPFSPKFSMGLDPDQDTIDTNNLAVNFITYGNRNVAKAFTT